jgi:hypothetical protein
VASYYTKVKIAEDEIFFFVEEKSSLSGIEMLVWEMNRNQKIYHAPKYHTPIGTIHFENKGKEAVARRGDTGFLFDMFREIFIGHEEFANHDELGKHLFRWKFSVMDRIGLNDHEIREWGWANR